MARVWISAVAAAAALFGAATAQTIVPQPHDLMASVSFEEVTPVLRDAGFTVEETTLYGAPVLDVRMGDRQMYFRRRACSAPGRCAGLWMIALPGGASDPATMNAFNQRTKPARISEVDGTLVLDRYLIADYGITRGTFVVNVGVFAQAIGLWADHVRAAPATQVAFAPLTPSAESGLSHEDREFLGALARHHRDARAH